MSTQKRSLAFVLNSKAFQSQELDDAINQMRTDGHAVETFAVADAAGAVASNCDVVVAAGGDGTISCVVSEMVGNKSRQPMVGVLPFGTGNDFAAACGIPANDLNEALRIIAEEQPRHVDLGKLNDRTFVNVVSGGFGAEVTAETSEELKAVLGKIAYTVAGVGKMFQSGDRAAKIHAEDFEWEGSLLFLSIANGRYAGGGYHVAPEAMLDDGLLDVLIVPDTGVLQAPSILMELFRFGTMAETEQVKYVRTPRLSVEMSSELQLSVDGEPLQATTFQAEASQQRIPLLLPAGIPLLN